MANDAENMEAAAKIMQAFQNQTNMMQQGSTNPAATSHGVGTNEFDNQGGEFAAPGDGNAVGMGFDNQGAPEPIIQPTQPIQPLNPTIQPPTAPPVQQEIVHPQTQPPQPVPSNPMDTPMPAKRSDVCPHCNTMHPPLNPGEKCPNVGIGEVGVSAGIDDTIINKHLVDMRNIIIANMTSKGIKDGKKFFQYAVIELTKALEVYHE